MKNLPTISIIVPVFNVENYLHRCIDSILNQSFKNFELLLIDDGSKDNSGNICNEYAEKDSRIKVFHKENGGVSSARNIGLDHAVGEWVAFVDADDEVADGYLNIGAQFVEADIIQKPFSVIDEREKENEYNQENFVLRKREDIFLFFVQKRNNALWDKLIKMKLIGDRRFNTEVSIGEDFLFFLSLLPKVRMWAFDKKGIYRHFVRKGSAMLSVDLAKRIEILWENILHIQNLTTKKDLFFLQKSIVYKSYIILLYSFRRKLNEEQKEKLKVMLLDMKVSELKYVDIKTKLKLLLYRTQFLL